MTNPDEAAAAEAALDALGVLGQNAIVLAAYEHAKAYSPGATTDAELAKADAELLRAVAAILAPALMALGEQRVRERLAERKQMVRDLGDMACIGCRANTCPACKLAAEITNQLYVAEADLAAAEQRGAEKALREAADDARSSPSTRLGDLHPGEVWAGWLDSRADRLAAQPGEASDGE